MFDRDRLRFSPFSSTGNDNFGGVSCDMMVLKQRARDESVTHSDSDVLVSRDSQLRVFEECTLCITIESNHQVKDNITTVISIRDYYSASIISASAHLDVLLLQK